MSNNLICDCTEEDCDRPHNQIELGMLEQLDVPDSSDSICFKCPKCKADSCQYQYDDTWLGFCLVCEIDFDVETGEIVEDLDKSHQTYVGKDETWYCTQCHFQSIWMSEATAHERNTLKNKPKTDKHTVIFVHDIEGTYWECECGEIFKSQDAGRLHESIYTSVNGNTVTSTSVKPEEEKHYVEYIKDSNKQHPDNKWRCIYCKAEFLEWKTATDHETPAGVKANRVGTVSTGIVSNYKHCDHPPKCVVDGKTWGVWAGRGNDCTSHLNDFDIILNLTGRSVLYKHEIPVPELSKWQSGNQKYKEFVLDWPDRGVVSLPSEFWKDLVNYLKTNSYKMVMFCVGGHGRTGTAMASLFVIACGMEPRAAIDKVHDFYCKEAIETEKQEKYVWEIAGNVENFKAKFTYTQTNTYQGGHSQTQLF